MQPELIATKGRPELASVFALRLAPGEGSVVETVDAIDPRFPRSEKSVIIVSTQLGCPVGCLICDAGTRYRGNLSAEQILAQVRFVLARRPELLETRKLKVHFARMGEPALNAAAVLEALERLPDLLPAPGLMACVTTIAPRGSGPFFAALATTKRRLYADGRFQLQLSLNSTDPATRARLMPGAPLLDLEALARLAAPCAEPGDRKVVLNFALSPDLPVDPHRLADCFDPARFIVKLTPVNPTARARAARLASVLSAAVPAAADPLVRALQAHAFEVVVSIGEPEEIEIGSNCGQLALLLDPSPRQSTPARGAVQ